MTRKEWVCLNRQGAKGAKGFIFEPLRREGREGFLLVFLIGTDDQENNHALRAGTVLGCLPCVLCRPSLIIMGDVGRFVRLFTFLSQAGIIGA